MTNFEKIKAMTIEEMAQNEMGGFFNCPYITTPDKNCYDDKDCLACVKHWLESEVEE